MTEAWPDIIELRCPSSISPRQFTGVIVTG
jgi:hypothetical protein